MPARVPVTAVLVARNGIRWLPTALSALASSTVTPARVVTADVAGSDDSAALLRRAAESVVELPETTGYAAAVAAALASAPGDTEWVWLLHDDCAPDPGTLSGLLRAAAAHPDAGVLGPRAVDWDEPRRLVEIGCGTDALGARTAGVEPGEPDQGQYDAVRPVLAVGTAGALVKRELWDRLGGLEPALPLREDLDLGWRAWAAGAEVLVVPSARLRHARAVTTGRRPLVGTDRPAAVDRRSALLLLLAHAPPLRLLALVPLLLLAGLLRALAALAGRQPREALDELAALPAVLVRAPALRRRRVHTWPDQLGSATARLKASAVALLDRGGARAVPALDEPAVVRRGPLHRLSRSPAALLGAGLLVVALLAVRDLLGRGSLGGGRLLPAPDGAGDLWSLYAAGGEAATGALALLGTATLGRPGIAVDLLLLGAVPLSGVAAAWAAGRVVESRVLQLWAGASWAVLPVATGAVAAGRLDAASAHLALPLLLVLGRRASRSDPRTDGWAPAWQLGLALAFATALAPLLWPLAVVLLGGGALLRVAASSPASRPAANRRALSCAVALATPVALLMPWTTGLLDPHGPGLVVPSLTDPALNAWYLLLLAPGGPGTPPVWLTVPLLLAAPGGLLRRRRAPVAAAGWAVALLGLAAATALARTTADGAAVWPGIPLDLAAAGMLLAALVGAEGLQEGLTRSTFGWRQLAAVALVVGAVAVPVLAAADWVRRGADGPLQRVDPQPLPAYAVAELAAAPDRRALLLAERDDGAVTYAVTDADGPRLGDRQPELDSLVADLLTPRGVPAAAAAAKQGVVLVAATGEGDVSRALDAQPGLDRQEGEGPPVWRVVPPAAAAPERPDRLGPLALAAQALAVLAVVVLAGPGRPPRRGLLR